MPGAAVSFWSLGVGSFNRNGTLQIPPEAETRHEGSEFGRLWSQFSRSCLRCSIRIRVRSGTILCSQALRCWEIRMHGLRSNRKSSSNSREPNPPRSAKSKSGVHCRTCSSRFNDPPPPETTIGRPDKSKLQLLILCQ